MVFMVGPENPDFTPYAEISPHVVKAFLTTEDAGFFRHRGFIPSQFRKALARNLKRGGFRLGASTISMQMVKNVLLSHEKTLSRKLQELFLVWYLEQELSKERIMEIYLNAIEFGPGIYGIGAAARHYFGKQPDGDHPAGGGVLRQHPAQPQAALRAVLPRRAQPRVGSLRAADPAAHGGKGLSGRGGHGACQGPADPLRAGPRPSPKKSATSRSRSCSTAGGRPT